MTAKDKLRRIDELVPYPNECPQWGGPDWREMARQINVILNEPEPPSPKLGSHCEHCTCECVDCKNCGKP